MNRTFRSSPRSTTRANGGFETAHASGSAREAALVATRLAAMPTAGTQFTKKEREIAAPKNISTGTRSLRNKGRARSLSTSTGIAEIRRSTATLAAFSAFAQCGVIDVAVLLTRGASMEPRSLKTLGEALGKDAQRRTDERWAAPKVSCARNTAPARRGWRVSFNRLNAGRNGGCPVLAIGITPKCIEDWSE